MNLRTFLGSLFTKANLNGELEHVRASARADAQLVVGTYVEEFKREASCILTEATQQFQDPETGCGAWPQPLFEDEGENPVDLETASRHELMRLAKDLGIKYTRTVTKVKLIEMLENS